MLKFYKLRIDLLLDKVDHYRHIEKHYMLSYVRSLEGIDEHNVHYHYYVEMTDKSVNLRRYIQNHIGKGNGVYSLKELDERYPIEYLSYIIKNDKNSVWYNMPPNLREAVKEYSNKVSLEIQEKRKKKRKNKVGMLSDCCEDCKTSDEVLSNIIDYYLESELILNPQHISNYYWTICLSKGLVSKSDYYGSQLRFVR